MTIASESHLEIPDKEESRMFEDNVAVPMPPNRTHRGLSGSILRMKDDSLLFVHGIETNPEKCEGWLEARVSQDDGRTWGEPFSPLPRVENFETIAPTLMRLDSGEILLFYTLEVLSARTPGWGDATSTLDSHVYVRRSSDEGVTWSDPICATHFPGLCESQADKVMRLSSGRIVIPAASFWPVSGDHTVSLCFYSDDQGYSWWPSRNFIDFGKDTHNEEPSVVEMEHGRLIMLCRTGCGYLARAYSEDYALTWSQPELVPELPEPCAGFHMVRVPATVDLLTVFCKNPHAPALYGGEKQPDIKVGELTIPLGRVRSPMTAAISKDNGQTWGNFRDITCDPEGVYGDYGYPGITWIEDGGVALVNYHALDGIRLARIGVNWFYGE